MQKPTTIFGKFLVWRLKHIPNTEFVYILSVLIGLVTGLIAILLKNITHLIQHLLHNTDGAIGIYFNYYYFVIPLFGLILTYLAIKYIVRNDVSHGIPTTLHSISKRDGVIRPFQMWGSVITSTLTVGFGGSVGLEGPTVSTGAAIGSNVARAFHLSSKTRIILLSAAAAGAMSAIFKVPIASIIFVVEVFSLDLTLTSLIPLLLASVSAVLTSYFLVGDAYLLEFTLKDKFAISDVPWIIVLAAMSGLVSIYFTQVYFKMGTFFDGILNNWHRVFIGGILLGVLIFIIPPLYGEGFEIINSLLQGSTPEGVLHSRLENYLPIDWAIIVLLIGLMLFKIIAASLTFGAKGVGGVFVPVLFMGSIIGNITARIINLLTDYQVSETNFTLLGMAGILAGVLHAPLTGVFLIAELTGGYKLIIPLIIVSAISYAITKLVIPHSVYHHELAKKGMLVTHNKDQAVLTMMQLERVVETNFSRINQEMTIGQLVHEVVSVSKRNMFPVVDIEDHLIGVLYIDDIRNIMFDHKIYETTHVRTFMKQPEDIIFFDDDMALVMKKFSDSGMWNIPVIKDGKYRGFVSRSKVLTAYRRKLIEFAG
ncbi:MAG: chloride channel protein [Ichthyobacteriaceae bacterium]|nr:chloride channel protein [Ichthyobacteriaceae bacterium]